MQKYEITHTNRYKKDFKLMVKQQKDINLLEEIIEKIANGETLEEKHYDHDLNGDYDGYRECHITPDWLLIYKIKEDILMLVLTRTGSHSDLFGKNR